MVYFKCLAIDIYSVSLSTITFLFSHVIVSRCHFILVYFFLLFIIVENKLFNDKTILTSLWMVSILCSVWLLTLCQLRQDMNRSSNQLVWTLNKIHLIGHIYVWKRKRNEGGEVRNLLFHLSDNKLKLSIRLRKKIRSSDLFPSIVVFFFFIGLWLKTR